MEESLNTQVKTGLEQIIKLNEERFKAFEKNVLERFHRIEKRITKLEQSNKQKEEEEDKEGEENSGWSFDTSGAFASKYIISENNKSPTARKETNYILTARIPLPAQEISKFSFYIIESHWIMVGILPEEVKNNKAPHEHKATVAYVTNGRLFCSPDDRKGVPCTPYSKGDTVSMEVNLQTGKTTVYKKVLEHILNKEYLSYKYYPYIFTGRNAGCRVKFV